MSYHLYWQLSEMPFGRTSQANDFFAGTTQLEAVARLQFLVNNSRSVGLLIGESGTGRTTLLNHINRHLVWMDVVETCLISGKGQDRESISRELAMSLGATAHKMSEADVWREICDALDSSARQDVQTVLLVDDASKETAELIGTLVNRSHRITALLGCDEQSSVRVAQEVGGCPLRIDLSTWTLEDSAIFVRQSVVNAGGHSQIFNDAAIVRLHELSDGRVAHLSRLAELSLLAGAGSRVPQVTPEIVEAVQEETLACVA